MDRVTYRLPAKQIEAAEHLVEEDIFPNRSEVLRTAVREWLLENHPESFDAPPPWKHR